MFVKGCMNKSSIWKCFKMIEILDLNVPWNFHPMQTCFGNISTKTKKQSSVIMES